MGVERTLLFFGTMVTTSCLAFAICSQFWVEFYFQGVEYNAGLWKVCSDNKEDKCSTLDDWLDGADTPRWLLQVRLLISVSVGLSAISILTSLLGLCHERVKCMFTSLSTFFCCALLAGVCVIYSEKKYYHNEHLLSEVRQLWGFYLTCGSAGWAFLLAIFGILADVKCKKDRTEELMYGIYTDV